MGTSTTYTSNEIKRAIADLKKIIHQGRNLDSKSNPIDVNKNTRITKEQEKVLQLRNEMHYSFAAIAEELQLSKKEVHKEFVTAYKLLQSKHEQQSA